MAERVLVVAAHPDDEVLGAGGTMAAHAERGDAVRVLILGEGEASRPGRPAEQAAAIAALEAAARAAGRRLGAEVSFAGLPDNAFDTVGLLAIIRPIEALIAEVRPSVLYTHHVGDLNIDHELTCRAVLTASRATGGPVPDLFSFEVRSSTDWSDGLASAPAFRPNVWRSLSTSQCTAKLDALGEYAREMRPWPHSRSVAAVEAQWRHRGAQAGTEAAEAFILLRSVRSA